MTPFAIAGLQLHLSGRHSNIDHVCDRIEMLLYLYPWVQMVVVSELATFGGWTGHAQPLPSPAETRYREIAARHKVWLLPGSFFERSGEHVYNTAPVINPAGEIVTRYRKMFPFLPYETGVESGTEFCVFDVPGVGRFGVSICYDMWFPETTRTLCALGAEVLLHPTLTASLDRDVELSIARATAAMNQCFVVDINGVGDGGIGRSIVVAPSGDVMYEAGTSEEMIPLEVDLDRVRRSREVGVKGLGQPLKSFRDRKVDFFAYDLRTRNGLVATVNVNGVVADPDGEVDGTAYLETLGPLVKQSRGSKAGLERRREGGEDPPPPDGEVPPAAASMAPGPIPPSPAVPGADAPANASGGEGTA